MKGHIEVRETKRKLPRGHHAWSIIIETGRTPSGRRGRRRFTFYGTKTQAEAEQARLVHQFETGALLNQDRMTVAEYLTHWLDVYAKPNTAPRTYERYEEIVRLHLSPALGAHRLGKLTPLHGPFSQGGSQPPSQVRAGGQGSASRARREDGPPSPPPVAPGVTAGRPLADDPAEPRRRGKAAACTGSTHERSQRHRSREAAEGHGGNEAPHAVGARDSHGSEAGRALGAALG